MPNFLINKVLPKLQNQRNEYLLKQLVKSAENHKIMNRWYRHFFAYLDRFYVKYHELPLLEEAGVGYFKTHIFQVVRNDASAAILDLIEKERECATIDKDLVR